MEHFDFLVISIFRKKYYKNKNVDIKFSEWCVSVITLNDVFL